MSFPAIPSPFEQLATQILRSPSLGEAASYLLTAGKMIGLPRVTVTAGLDRSGPILDVDGQPVEETVLGWPSELVDIWYARDYSLKHPDVRSCLDRHLPFLGILDRHSDRMLPDEERDAVIFTGSFGIRSQIMVPVHAAHGQTAFVSWLHWKTGAALDVHRDHHEGLMCLAYAFINRVGQGRRIEIDAAVELLSPRQRNCIYWLAQGKTAKEIAYLMDLSVFTVQDHIKLAMRRLGARSSAHLVALTGGMASWH
jgi:LuxR family quorum-sensing system transcriptional regulator CciR